MGRRDNESKYLSHFATKDFPLSLVKACGISLQIRILKVTQNGFGGGGGGGGGCGGGCGGGGGA